MALRYSDQRAVRHHRTLGQGRRPGRVEELDQVLGARLGTVVGFRVGEPGEEGVVGVPQGQGAGALG
jgi:hypothetical protein